jgi:hypothetical protein
MFFGFAETEGSIIVERLYHRLFISTCPGVAGLNAQSVLCSIAIIKSRFVQSNVLVCIALRTYCHTVGV